MDYEEGCKSRSRSVIFVHIKAGVLLDQTLIYIYKPNKVKWVVKCVQTSLTPLPHHNKLRESILLQHRMLTSLASGKLNSQNDKYLWCSTHLTADISVFWEIIHFDSDKGYEAECKRIRKMFSLRSLRILYSNSRIFVTAFSYSLT